MPGCPIGQEFWPKYNVGIFAPKLVDTIFSGPKNKCKILSKDKKYRVNIVRKYPKLPLVKNFAQATMS